MALFSFDLFKELAHIAIPSILQQSFVSVGKMMAFMTSTFTDLILRVALAFILSALLDSAIGIWLAWPIGWSIAVAISYCWYRHTLKQELPA